MVDATNGLANDAQSGKPMVCLRFEEVYVKGKSIPGSFWCKSGGRGFV